MEPTLTPRREHVPNKSEGKEIAARQIGVRNGTGFSLLAYVPVGYSQRNGDGNRPPTATPIKHVIIIVGENRSFDHVFAA